MRFFKNASKTQYNGQKKVILRGRALKCESIHPSQKVAEEFEKKLSISNAPEIK